MKKYIIQWTCVVLFFSSLQAQQETTASVSGTILLPGITQDKRSFRGRMYRNRLASVSKQVQERTSKLSSLNDVIVSAHPLSFEAEIQPMEVVNILQINAEFIPHVVAVTPGTEIQFINRDRFYHNVFSITPGARFNIGRRPTGVIIRRRIDKTGEIKLFCDIHAQMNAIIKCLDTPFFTQVNANGNYKLEGLPPGKYELRIYHPETEEITEEITLGSGTKQIKNFTLSR